MTKPRLRLVTPTTKIEQLRRAGRRMAPFAHENRVNCNLAAARFVDKRTGNDTRCFLLADQVARIQKRAARVYDIVNKQHSAAGKVQFSLTDQAHVARTLLPMAVAAKPYELDARSAANAIKRTDKVCDKDKAAHQ